MPDRIVKVINLWGSKTKKEVRKIKLKILDHKGQKFNWDNEDVEEDKNIEGGQDKLVHQDIIATIPGVELESNYHSIVGQKKIL